MRIAVCISGQLRNREIAYKNQIWFWKKNGHEVDYFVHTWKYSADRTSVSKPYVYRDIDDSEYNQFIEVYKPKKHMFDGKQQSFFYDYDHWSSLFYSFSQSILLKREYEIENGFEYDIVIKSRPDVVFDPCSNCRFDKLDNNTLFSTHGGIMEHEFNMFNVNDCVFFANSYSSMSHLFLFFVYLCNS